MQHPINPTDPTDPFLENSPSRHGEPSPSPKSRAGMASNGPPDGTALTRTGECRKIRPPLQRSCDAYDPVSPPHYARGNRRSRAVDAAMRVGDRPAEKSQTHFARAVSRLGGS